MSKVQNRNTSLVRQLTLLGLLNRGRWGLYRLSLELGVCERTIRRDIAALEEARIPVICESVTDVGRQAQKLYWSVVDWRRAGEVQLEVFDVERKRVLRVPDPAWGQQLPVRAQ